MLIGLEDEIIRKTFENCDAERISAGVHLEILPQQNQSLSSMSKRCSNLSISSQIPSQSLPKPSQIFPRGSQNPPKMDPKSTPKASWSPFWPNPITKLRFERSKNVQEAPKRADKAQRGSNLEAPEAPKSRSRAFKSDVGIQVQFCFQFCVPKCSKLIGFWKQMFSTNDPQSRVNF